MRNRRLVWILAAGMFLIGIDLYIVSPILPSIASDLQVRLGSAGLLVTAFALPYGLLALVFGPISDRVGRRRMLLTALPIFVLASAVTALAPSFPILLVARAVAGAAGAAFTPSLYAIVGDVVSPAERPRAMGVIMGGATTGMILGVPVGAWIAQFTSWRGSFWFVTGISFLVLAVLAAVLPRTGQSRSAQGGTWAAYRIALSAPGAVLALVTSGLFFGFGNGVYTFVGGVLEQRFHLSIGESGLILAAFGVTNFLGNMLTPVALRLLVTPRRSVITGLAGMALAVALIMLVPVLPLWLVTVMLGVWGLACGFTLPIQQSILAGLGGEARGTLLSLGSASMYLGIMVATGFVSIAFDRGGSAGAGLLGILAFAFAMLSTARIPENRTAVSAVDGAQSAH